MKWISVMVVSAFLLLAGYVPCAANEVSINVNSKIRATSRSFPGRQLEGTVVRANPYTFWLRVEGQSPVAIRLASLTSLDVSAGKKRRAGSGALIGLLVGGTVGVLAGASVDDGDPNELFYISKEGWMAIGGIGIGLSPQRQGGLALSAAVAF